MKRFELESENNYYTFDFPTSLSEITAEYLDNVTSNVVVADNYTLVGIVYHESLGSVILARKQSKKSITGGVVPIFIKAGNTDNEFIKSAKCKDKLIIASSQLSLGHHVVAPANTLSLDYFIRTLDKDNNVARRYNNTYGQEECYFVEFKLVPNCDIVGFYDTKDNKFYNPYIDITPKVGEA